MLYLRLFILPLFLLLNKDLFAQRYEFGLGGYTTSYMGDLNTNNLFYYTNFAGGVFAKYNLTSTWNFKLSYNYLALSASDSDFKNSKQQTRNLSFNNDLSELSLVSEFNFFNLYTKSRAKSRRYTPYLLAGLGVIHHNPYVYYGHEKIFLQDLFLETNQQGEPINYSNFALVIPLGLGVKYKINENWKIAAEINYRIVCSDYIDNVNGYYPGNLKPNAPLPKVKITTENGIVRDFEDGDWYFLSDPSNNYAKNNGTLRGDGKQWDGYMTTGLTLSYTLQNNKCTW